MENTMKPTKEIKTMLLMINTGIDRYDNFSGCLVKQPLGELCFYKDVEQLLAEKDKEIERLKEQLRLCNIDQINSDVEIYSLKEKIEMIREIIFA